MTGTGEEITSYGGSGAIIVAVSQNFSMIISVTAITPELSSQTHLNLCESGGLRLGTARVLPRVQFLAWLHPGSETDDM